VPVSYYDLIIWKNRWHSSTPFKARSS